MSALNKNLKPNFEAAVDDYVNALLYMWSDYDKEDPTFSPAYGYWVGDDKSGVYCYEDWFYISLTDIIYCVENKVSHDEYQEWQDYCVEAAEFGFDTPNLKSWHKGCPRVPQETCDELNRRRRELDALVEYVKHNSGVKL